MGEWITYLGQFVGALILFGVAVASQDLTDIILSSIALLVVQLLMQGARHE